MDGGCSQGWLRAGGTVCDQNHPTFVLCRWPLRVIRWFISYLMYLPKLVVALQTDGCWLASHLKGANGCKTSDASQHFWIHSCRNNGGFRLTLSWSAKTSAWHTARTTLNLGFSMYNVPLCSCAYGIIHGSISYSPSYDQQSKQLLSGGDGQSHAALILTEVGWLFGIFGLT